VSYAQRKREPLDEQLAADAEAEAEAPAVCPLRREAKLEISFWVWSLPQLGQTIVWMSASPLGAGDSRTILSNSTPHSLQVYS